MYFLSVGVWCCFHFVGLLRKNTFENCRFTRAYQQLQVDITETPAGCLYCVNSAELSNDGEPVRTD